MIDLKKRPEKMTKDDLRIVDQAIRLHDATFTRLAMWLVRLAQWIYPKSEAVMAFYAQMMMDEMIYGKSIVRVDPKDTMSGKEELITIMQPPPNDFWSDSPFEEKNIVNPKTYRGKGRPRKTDYINAIEASRIANKDMSDFLDKRRAS